REELHQDVADRSDLRRVERRVGLDRLPRGGAFVVLLRPDPRLDERFRLRRRGARACGAEEERDDEDRCGQMQGATPGQMFGPLMPSKQPTIRRKDERSSGTIAISASGRGSYFRCMKNLATSTALKKAIATSTITPGVKPRWCAPMR